MVSINYNPYQLPSLPIIEASEVTNLQAESANYTTLVISWGPPATPNGNILGYSINIINLKDGSSVRMQENVLIVIGNLTEINLGN